MKSHLQKKLKFILYTSIIFYVGFLLIGVIPYHFYDVLIWETNLFMKIVGGILGFVIFITIIANIYTSIMMVVPYKTIYNLIVVKNTILSLIVIDTMFSDQKGFSDSVAVIIFLSLGSVIIIGNIINLLIISKQNEETLIAKWDNSIEKLDSLKNKNKSVVKLVNIFAFVFVAAIFFNFNFNSVIDYMLLLLMAGYVIRNYYKYFKLENHMIGRVVIIFIILLAISSFILISYDSFLTEHSVLRGLVILLPYTHISILVLPDSYKQMWLDTNNNI